MAVHNTQGMPETFSTKKAHADANLSEALNYQSVQVISMANTDVTLVVGKPTATQTQLKSNILRVDPGGVGTPDLILPTEASLKGITLEIYNSGSDTRDFRVRDDGDSRTHLTLIAGESGTVSSDGTVLRSNVMSGSRSLAHQTQWFEHDELNGQIDTEIDHKWILNAGSDAQALDPAPDTAQAGGVWKLVTGNADGAVANDGSQMVWADMPIQLDSAGGNTVIEARIRIKSAITTCSVSFGLTDSTALEEPFSNATDTITAVAADAVAFLYDSAATTDTWWGVAVDSTTKDGGNASTGVAPVADAWQILTIEISNDGATINFYINGGTASLALSGSTGVGPNVVLYPFVIANATTTTSRTVDVDYVRVEGVR